jgi:hypothetical protein
LKTAAGAAFLAAQPIHRIDVASVQKAAIARQAHSQLREHVSLMEQRAQMAEEAVQYAAALAEALAYSWTPSQLQEELVRCGVNLEMFEGDERVCTRASVFLESNNLQAVLSLRTLRPFWTTAFFVASENSRHVSTSFSKVLFLSRHSKFSKLKIFFSRMFGLIVPSFVVELDLHPCVGVSVYFCFLLDPEWLIPGLSPSMSARVKEFLAEIEDTNFWTHHRPVAAVDDSAIQRREYEGCLLLFHTAGMDCLHSTVADEATHFLYWPMVLLCIIIGPHMSNSKCNRARWCCDCVYV